MTQQSQLKREIPGVITYLMRWSRSSIKTEMELSSALKLTTHRAYQGNNWKRKVCLISMWRSHSIVIEAVISDWDQASSKPISSDKTIPTTIQQKNSPLNQQNCDQLVAHQRLQRLIRLKRLKDSSIITETFTKRIVNKRLVVYLSQCSTQQQTLKTKSKTSINRFSSISASSRLKFHT